MSLNLLRDPWLPVRRASGRVGRIAPWQVTEALTDDPALAFAWGRPDFDGAAHEFLIGLLATAFAPADEPAWRAYQANPPGPQTLRQAFAPWADHFDLDGPGPRFLQDLAPLDDEEERPIAQLLIDAAGDKTIADNTDLFVKRVGAFALGRPAAAMALFTLQAFAPSGGRGHRTSLRGGGPLTTLAVWRRPESRSPLLWDRLWPNVETAEDIRARASESELSDSPEAIFPWLVPTRTSEAKGSAGETAPTQVHPLQVYWGMPRRLRLAFEETGSEVCGLTGQADEVVVRSYRTKAYGINYGTGFNHPLTPYYRPTPKDVTWLPVHGRPGILSYRHWPNLVAGGEAEMRRAAAVVVRARDKRRRELKGARLAVFGYDMDNAKVRSWIEGEHPLFLSEGPEIEVVIDAARKLVAGTDQAARTLVGTVKAALFDRPKDAGGDFSLIGERLWRETEAEFFQALAEARDAAAAAPEADDPAAPIRAAWRATLERTTLPLFEELAPIDGIESRDMARYVGARFTLTMTLRGHGKSGEALFTALSIPLLEKGQKKRRRKGAA